MRAILVFGIACAIAGSPSAVALDINGPPPTFWWTRLNNAEKAVYIAGLCDAFESTESPLGEAFCKPPTRGELPVNRFCSARFAFPQAGGVDDMPGVREFDRFFADKNHSDLPSWTAIAAFNDRACGENSVLSRLPSMQEKGLCEHRLQNMQLNRFPDETIDAQKKVCDRLK